MVRSTRCLKACRCCLSTEENSLSLAKSPLHILDLLVGRELDLAELWLCYRCSHAVRKICRFRDLCSRVHAVLQEYSTIQNNNVARNYFLEEKEAFCHGTEPSLSNTLCIGIIVGNSNGTHIQMESFSRDWKPPRNYTDDINTFHESTSEVNIKLDPEIDNIITYNLPDTLVSNTELVNSNNHVGGFSNQNKEDCVETKFKPLLFDELTNILQEVNETSQRSCLMEEQDPSLPFYDSPDQISSADSNKLEPTRIKKRSKKRKTKLHSKKSLTKSKHPQKTMSDAFMKDNVLKDIAEEVERACDFQLTLEEQMKEKENRTKEEPYIRATYKCELCVVIFQSQLAMNNHKKKHLEPVGPYSCPVCSLRFPKHDLLASHSTTHALRLICQLCDKRFFNKKTFRNHLIWHSGYMKCKECGKSFNASSTLKEHRRRIHSSGQITKFECETCGKVFFSHSLFSVHLQRHSGVPTHTCTICSKGFFSEISYSYHLERHKKTTSDHYCVECDRHFKSLIILNSHLKYSLAHRDVAILKFKCPECPMAFHSEKFLMQHAAARHGGVAKFVCDACGVSYAFRSGLVKHIKCVHEGFKRPKKFSCPLCDKVFSTKVILDNHVRTHTRERPFKCLQCPDTFRQKSTLGNHVKLVHLKIKRNVKKKKKAEDQAEIT